MSQGDTQPPGQTHLPPDLLAPVKPGEGYDELLDGDRLRTHWQRLADHISAQPPRPGQLDKASGHLGGRTRPWRLDPLPYLVQASEWAYLEQGLLQRTRLLNAVVGDLYGDQRLLKDHGLPPALVFANPRYQMALQGQPARDDVFLNFVAFDLGRSPDGQWRVLSDRTETPIGLGFALENRVAVARLYPELFATTATVRLAGFLRAHGRHVANLGAGAGQPGLTVILSTGPEHAPYFEHTYLGRYLGFPVVEGGDLTVRDGRVYLKSLEGLKPVGTILRNVDSSLADPLELSSQTLVGTPGLANAARNGAVCISNALGSGVVQNDALTSFLPALSEVLLGETLQLPALASWWCGQPDAAEAVRAHIADWVVEAAFEAEPLTSRSVHAYQAAPGDPAQQQTWLQAIGEQPYAYVAHEPIKLSLSPYWHDEGGLARAPASLRLFVAATDQGYQLMPGGLMRIATPDGDVVQDVWVPGDAAAPVATTPAAGPVTRRNDRDLPSRTADDLYWLGRYLERTEGAVRTYRSLYRLLANDGENDYPVELPVLTDVLVSLDYLSAKRARRAVAHGRAAVEQEIWQMLFDTESNDGLANLLSHVNRTSDHVRERLSNDAWRIFESLPATPNLRWRLHTLTDALDLLDELIVSFSAVTGQIYDNMTRDYGWRLLDLGRRIERVRFAARVIRQLATDAPDTAGQRLELLLDIQDSTITYWSRYQQAPTLRTLLDLLLLDESNPRSMLNQVNRMQRHMDVMPQESTGAGLSEGQRTVLTMQSELRLADLDKLAGVVSRAGRRTHLQRLLRRSEDGADHLSVLVSQTYFEHTAGPRR